MDCPHCRDRIILLHDLDIKEIIEKIEKAQMLPDWDLIDEVKDILQRLLI
jgi:translation elongation factor EF-Tu-like GTPase